MLVDRERRVWYIERSGEHRAWDTGERRGRDGAGGRRGCGGAVVRDSSGTGSLEVNGTKSFAMFFIRNGNVF